MEFLTKEFIQLLLGAIVSINLSLTTFMLINYLNFRFSFHENVTKQYVTRRECKIRHNFKEEEEK